MNYPTTYFFIIQPLNRLTSAESKFAGHIESCCAVEDNSEIVCWCVAPMSTKIEMLKLMDSVWPTAYSKCMQTIQQLTCDASHWPSCHGWTATYMLLQGRSSLIVFICAARPARSTGETKSQHLTTKQGNACKNKPTLSVQSLVSLASALRKSTDRLERLPKYMT